MDTSQEKPMRLQEESETQTEKGRQEQVTSLTQVASFSKELEAKVRRKLDFNIIPLILVVYMLSVLDRSNVGNARIAGMSTDLHLIGNRYDWLLTIFYIPCTARNFPFNLDICFEWLTMLWKIFKPHQYAAGAIFLWGLVATLQATTTSWAGMMACRFFLGLTECGFGPGLTLYLSFFYPRHEIGLRIGIYIAGSALASAYGGALAYGLSHITSGIAPWRLLFILEGIPTCLMAIVVWFYLPDAPDKCRFLNEEEKKIATARAQRQPRSFDFQGFSASHFFDAFLDYRSIPLLVHYLIQISLPR
jgi:MFS family permease